MQQYFFGILIGYYCRRLYCCRLQVNKKLLFKGATKENVKAYLAAKQVLSARGPHKDPPAVFQILSAHAPTQVRGDTQQQEQNKTWSEEENTQRMAAGDRRRASAEEEAEAHARGPFMCWHKLTTGQTIAVCEWMDATEEIYSDGGQHRKHESIVTAGA